MTHFRNGYPYLAHPRVFKALEEINGTEQVADGEQQGSRLDSQGVCLSRCQRPFPRQWDVTNLVFLSGVLKAYEGVIACAFGHINVEQSAVREGTANRI